MPNVKPISFNIRHITIPLIIIVTIITPTTSIETKTQFLQDELTTADKNYLIQNYLSTKYTYWNKHTRGEHVKIGIFDSGINNTYTNCNIKQQLDFSSSTTPSTNNKFCNSSTASNLMNFCKITLSSMVSMVNPL
jgi:hypothetical protein